MLIRMNMVLAYFLAIMAHSISTGVYLSSNIIKNLIILAIKLMIDYDWPVSISWLLISSYISDAYTLS